MNTAKIKVSAKLIEDLLFGYSPAPVYVHGVIYDPDAETAVFEISGVDVPEANEVFGHITQTTNRAGQKLITLTFEPVK